jgi:hypothetical protein
MILTTALRNDLANQIDASVNTGTGTAQLKFETVADAALATLNLQNPAFGTAATGVITLQGTPLSDTSAAAGTCAQASVYDRTTPTAEKQFEMSVGTGAQDIVISSTVFGAGDTVQLTSLTVTVPAS